MLGGIGRGGQVHSHNFRLLAPQRATQLGRVSQRNLARGLHVIQFMASPPKQYANPTKDVGEGRPVPFAQSDTVLR